MTYLFALELVIKILETVIVPVSEKTDNKIDDAVVHGFLAAAKKWID